MIRRRALTRLAIVLLAIFLALTAGVPPASAHALLQRASPAPGAVLRSTPAAVALDFSEDLNGLASRIVVWDRARHDETIGAAQIVPGRPRELRIALRPLSAGSYLVLWTSVSADDGHVLRGSYSFSVGHPGPLPSLAGVGSGGEGTPDGQTAASIVAHWIELLAAVVWTGAEAFALFVLPGSAPEFVEEERRRLVLVRTGLVLLLLASLGVLALLAQNLAGSWGDSLTGQTLDSLFSDRYGQYWLARQTIVLIAFGLSFVALRNSTWRRVLPVVLAACYLVLFAASGHAASSGVGELGGSPVFSAAVLIDWFHFVADALWFGGQIYIALVLLPLVLLSRESIRALLDTLSRFSVVAYTSVALYILSGAFAAKIHIPSWYAFFNSVYGRTLIVKMGLVGLMMGVSVLTVYVLRPRLRGALGADDTPPERTGALLEGLQFWLRVNPVLGTGVLLATSVLFYYPVPFGFGPPGPSSYTVSANGITATLILTPGRAGPNRVTVRLRGLRGQAVGSAHVSILSTMLDMPMGSGVVPMTESTSGRFTGQADLAMGGHWRLLVLVYRPHPFLTRLSVTVTVGQ